jgi:hypothetical protein
MSLTADPMFVAAEVQWRRDRLSVGFPDAGRAHRHHGVGVRAAFTAIAHPHRHGRSRTRGTGAPRVA